MNAHGYIPIPLREASCIIAHLFVELAMPCSCCEQDDGLIVIQGTTYDGSGAKITIKGEEVKYYGKQRTLEAIRAGKCRPPALRPRKAPGDAGHHRRQGARETHLHQDPQPQHLPEEGEARPRSEDDE